jgi:predicted membrane channel-forming protein YqfA (hemolysin III family)
MPGLHREILFKNKTKQNKQTNKQKQQQQKSTTTTNNNNKKTVIPSNLYIASIFIILLKYTFCGCFQILILKNKTWLEKNPHIKILTLIILEGWIE